MAQKRSSPRPTSSSSEAKGQSLLTWVPAATGMVGVAIGALASLGAVWMGNSHDRDEARRQEELSAYAGLYGETAEYLADIGSVAPLLIELHAAPKPNRAKLERLDQRLDAHGADIFRAQSLVVLVGGDGVANVGFALSAEAEHLRQTLTSKDVKQEQIAPALESMAMVLDDFARAARLQLDG